MGADCGAEMAPWQQSYWRDFSVNRQEEGEWNACTFLFILPVSQREQQSEHQHFMSPISHTYIKQVEMSYSNRSIHHGKIIPAVMPPRQ